MMRRLLISGLLVAVALAGLAAARQATFVMRNGERHTGTFTYHKTANLNLIVNGQDTPFPWAEVAVIEFDSGDPTATELAQLTDNPSELQRDMIVLRNGTMVKGKIHDFMNDEQLDIDVAVGDRRPYNLSDVSRIYTNGSVARTVFNYSGPGAVATSGTMGGSVQVLGNQAWTDTGISVRRGDRLSFTTTGQIHWGTGADQVAGPDGSSGGGTDLPIPGMGVGGLIGRVGNGQPFAIGSNSSPITMPANGRLYLGVNDKRLNDNSGTFTVTIQR